MKKVWYCIECDLAGVGNYYDSKEELLKAHPVLKEAQQLITTKEVEEDELSQKI